MQNEPTGYLSAPALDASYYLNAFTNFFTTSSGDFMETARNLIGILVGISIPVSIFLMIAIVITVEKIKKIRTLEEEKFSTPAEPAFQTEEADPEFNKRWRAVIELADSKNPNDWKQSIIEADILLDKLVTKLGYQGETLGEKLKRTTKGDFRSRDAAWEAHLVRNRIAHDGSAFDLNQIEAKKIVGLYRQVFEEFYTIS